MKSCRRWFCILIFLVAPAAAAQKTVLFRAPVSVQAPGHNGMMTAWTDGERYWVDIAHLTKFLGYEVEVMEEGSLVIARDARGILTFDAGAGTLTVNREERLTNMETMLGTKGQLLIHLDAIQTAFGSDLSWDEDTLTLQLSSRATLFDPGQFGQRNKLGSERPVDVLFPRRRRILGGLRINYNLRHQWSETGGHTFDAGGTVSAAMLGGVVRSVISPDNPNVNYTFETGSPLVTRVGVSWARGMQLPSFRVTNAPLVPRRIFGERTLNGTTIPHAIVRGKAGGTLVEQVQADREGRYAVRVPVFYGTTRSSVEVQPLGEPAMEEVIYYDLTPQTALPPGTVQYDVSFEPDQNSGTAEARIGVHRRLTLQGRGGMNPTRARAGATLRVGSALYTEVSADVLHETGFIRASLWRSRGGGELSYHRYGAGTQNFQVNGRWQFERVSLGTRISHRLRPPSDPVTEITPRVSYYSGKGVSASLGANWVMGQEGLPSLTPRLAWSRSFLHMLFRVGAGVDMREGEVRVLRGSVRLSSRWWSFVLEANQTRPTGDLGVRVRSQLRTDWAWLGVNAHRKDSTFSIESRLQGSVNIDARGIHLGSDYHDYSQAVFRVFVDENLNGKRDAGERLLPNSSLHLHGPGVRRAPNGELRSERLSPNETYTVELLVESIRDPSLFPNTGYEFAFVAESGRTRYIDIALQRLPQIRGRVLGWTGAYEVLQVVMVGGIGGKRIERMLDVYRGGPFFTQLLPGEYEVILRDQLTDQVVTKQTLTVTRSRRQTLEIQAE